MPVFNNVLLIYTGDDSWSRQLITLLEHEGDAGFSLADGVLDLIMNAPDMFAARDQCVISGWSSAFSPATRGPSILHPFTERIRRSHQKRRFLSVNRPEY